jgi:hypothetical protein
MVNLFEMITTQERLSLNLALAGMQQEAVALAEDAIATARSWARDPGATAESLRELPRAYAAMAATLGAAGKRGEARKWYRAATEEWNNLRSKGMNFPDCEDEIEEARRGAEEPSPALPLRH